MRFARPVIVSCILACALCACKKDNAGTTLQDRGRYTEEAVVNLIPEDPVKAMALIDSAQMVGNIDADKADFFRSRALTEMEDKASLDSAQVLCEDLLRRESVKKNDDKLWDVLEQFIRVARVKMDYEELIRRATQFSELCWRKGNRTDALRTEAEIGLVMTMLGQNEDGLAKIDHTISELGNVRRFAEMDAVIIASKRKINVLFGLHRPAEVIPVARRIIEMLDDYELHPDEFDDGSYRQPSDEESRRGYIDFYKAQAIGFLTEAYALTGDRKNAAEYLSLYDKTSFSKCYGGRRMIIRALDAIDDFPRVLPIYDEMEKKMGSDTLNSEYAAILRGRARAEEARGHHTSSQSYWLRYSSLTGNIYNHLLEGKANEYSARYHAQEQQLKIQRKEAESRRRTSLAIAFLFIAIVSGVFVIILGRHNRKMSRKNHVLAAQISEAIEYKTKYLEEVASVRSGEEAAPSPACVSQMSSEELFAYISDTIRKQQLFRDPSFGRQTIMDSFGLSKDSASSVFSHGSEYSRISDFVNDCRLEYACALLLKDPAKSIADVASESGFARYTTFSRLFKEKYSITPTVFREQNGV